MYFQNLNSSIFQMTNIIFQTQHQKNILAKAYLFIQTVPIYGKNRGIDASSRNGVSLKAKLLREGAYYWYQDNSNIVDFENVSITDTLTKKTYKINH